jgi:hypothetical protein
MPRLLLVLLLALLPLLAPAAQVPAAGTDPSDAPSAIGQMPCHGDATGTVHHDAAKPQPPCPHCDGDGPVSACQCCGKAAPAELTVAALMPTGSFAVLSLPAVLPSVFLPLPTAGRLFRPPILQG